MTMTRSAPTCWHASQNQPGLRPTTCKGRRQEIALFANSLHHLSPANSPTNRRSNSAFSSAGSNEARTAFSDNFSSTSTPQPNVLAQASHSSVSVVLNIGGSSELRYRPPAPGPRGSAPRGRCAPWLLMPAYGSVVWRRLKDLPGLVSNYRG